MDPIASIAFLCNVFDLAERTIKCVKIAKETYDSASGLPRQYETLSEFTTEMTAISIEVQRSHKSLNILGPMSNDTDSPLKSVASSRQEISLKITAILEKCRSKKAKSMGDSVKATLRHLFAKNELETLQKELESNHQRLQTVLALSTRSELDQLKKVLDDMNDYNKQLSNMLYETHRKLYMLEEIPRQLEHALNISKQFQATKSLELVLHKLGMLENFSRPNSRYDDVRDASLGTYEWIMNEPEKLLRVERKLRVTFPEWLRKGDGVFHVAGKPGAGKSTLMKYICEHAEVRKHLQDWARPDRLLFTKYFFWKPDDLQNGFRGLRRCLLWDAVNQAPELCAILFPQLEFRHMEPLNTMAPEFSDKEVSLALEAFWDHVGASDSIHVFVMLDGLDEFQENFEDHNDLVRTIQSWILKAAGRAKFCVSSREYDAFSVFPEYQRIRLHKLTANDIRAVILERLASHPRFPQLKEHLAFDWLEMQVGRRTRMSQLEKTNPEKYHEHLAHYLIEDIVAKAEGVFLWIDLLLRDLRKCLDGGFSISHLQSRVDILPKELEKFLKHLLDTIHPQFQRETYIILAIIDSYERSKSDKQSNSDSGISSKGASYFFHNPGTLEMGLSVCIEGIKSGFNELNQEQIGDLCNGLLDIGECYYPYCRRPAVGDGSAAYIRFTHRSVLEVLRKHLQSKLIEHGITTKILGQSACQLVIYELIYAAEKSDGIWRSNIGSFIYDKMDALFAGLNSMCVLNETSVLKYLSIIDDFCLEFWFGTRTPSTKDVFDHSHKLCIAYYTAAYYTAETYGPFYYSVILHAAQLDHLSYIFWCLKSGRLERYGMLPARILWILRYCASPDALALIRALFENGFYCLDDENREMDMLHRWQPYSLPETPLRLRDGLFCRCRAPPAMVCRYHIVEIIDDFSRSWATKEYWGVFHDIDRWELMELWMEFMADALYKLAPVEGVMNKTFDGRSAPQLQIIIRKHGEWIPYRHVPMIDYRVWEQIESTPQRYLTLQDIVELERPKNIDRLLELIDRNIKHQYAREEADNRAAFEELPSSEIIDYEYLVLKESRRRFGALFEAGRQSVCDTLDMIVSRTGKMSNILVVAAFVMSLVTYLIRSWISFSPM